MDEFAVLRVRLTPKGGRDALTKLESGVLHARVCAPAVDGAANRALVLLLSDRLGIARSAIGIVRGETSRNKELRIAGLSTDALSVRIRASLNAGDTGR
jgi:uncharacterized protein (TIGR00251 family)